MGSISSEQRQQRYNIRSLFILGTVAEMEDAKQNYGSFGVSVLQEMIDTCKSQGVDSFDETY